MNSKFRAACVLCVCLAVTGCTTRSRARAEAQAAFAAGQQQAAQAAQRTAAQPQGPTVIVVGPVKFTSIPWTAELTVARAIVAAEYVGTADPHQIIILRNGQTINVEPSRLLNGEDQPLEAGDVLQLKP